MLLHGESLAGVDESFEGVDESIVAVDNSLAGIDTSLAGVDKSIAGIDKLSLQLSLQQLTPIHTTLATNLQQQTAFRSPARSGLMGLRPCRRPSTNKLLKEHLITFAPELRLTNGYHQKDRTSEAVPKMVVLRSNSNK